MTQQLKMLVTGTIALDYGDSGCKRKLCCQLSKCSRRQEPLPLPAVCSHSFPDRISSCQLNVLPYSFLNCGTVIHVAGSAYKTKPIAHIRSLLFFEQIYEDYVSKIHEA